jgi:hypothetical protein
MGVCVIITMYILVLLIVVSQKHDEFQGFFPGEIEIYMYDTLKQIWELKFNLINVIIF